MVLAILIIVSVMFALQLFSFGLFIKTMLSANRTVNLFKGLEEKAQSLLDEADAMLKEEKR